MSLPTAGSTTWRERASLGLMTASGFAGLGYQIVWTGQVAPWVGHEAAAVLAVIAAFFGGLAVGARVCGSAIERSARPARWYVACELLIAAWAIALTFAMAPFGRSIIDLIGVDPAPAWQWIVVFGSTFLLLLPATAAMGATLPALERAMSGGGRRSLAAPYACNTAGAMLGVVTCTFWLIPTWGMTRTAALCAVVNGCCALGASRVLPSRNEAPTSAATSARSPAVLGRLWMTGFLGIGYEVVVVRVLSQVTEDTVYTFALLLAVYLAGTSIGAAVYRRLPRTAGDERAVVDRLTIVAASACLFGTGTLWGAERWHDALLARLPVGIGAAIASEGLLAAAAFALPTIAMGVLFTALCDRATGDGEGYGRAIGVNTFGAACAPLVFGVLLIPLMGPKDALLLVVAGYLATMGFRVLAHPLAWLAAALAGVVLVAAPALAFVDVPDGGRVISYRDGIAASVSVVEDAGGVERLRIDNRQQEGTSATAFVDGRQALLPLALHPAPHHALFLGVGTGITATLATRLPELEVDAVELLPEVVAASHLFTDRLTNGVPDPRLHLSTADARRWVRASDRHYDVIVADNFHPARSGSGALYTVEHFQAIRERLGSDGLFCQWLPLHQLDLTTLRSIVGSFVDVFPDGFAILANNSLDTPVIGLVARQAAQPIDPVALRQRVADRRQALAGFGLDDAYAVLGSIVSGPAALARFAAQAPLNRDDRPVVAYLAPRATYAPEASPRRRLLAWLHDAAVEPGEVVDERSDPSFAARLVAYRHARDRFISAGENVRPVADVVAMLAQVRAPLLDVLRISPDFRPAYDPLSRMAEALRPIDAAAADALLEELAAVRPPSSIGTDDQRPDRKPDQKRRGPA